MVTHGQLAAELVERCGDDRGDMPQCAAVSIGGTMTSIARARRSATPSAGSRLRRAVRTMRPATVLVLTDMFGGTPTTSRYVRDAHVEVITGVKPPMLIRLARPRTAWTCSRIAR